MRPLSSVGLAVAARVATLAASRGIAPTAITLEEDPTLTAAYPAQQGSEVIATLRDGSEVRKRLADLTPASYDDVRARFTRSAAPVAAMVDADDFQALGAYLTTL